MISRRRATVALAVWATVMAAFLATVVVAVG